MSVVGVSVTVVTALVVEHPWVFVIAGLIGAGAGGGGAYLFSRQLRPIWDRELVEAPGPVPRSRAVAIVHGVLWGLVAIAAGFAVLVVEAVVLGDDELFQVAGPLLLVFAFMFTILRRDLRRWQRRIAQLAAPYGAGAAASPSVTRPSAARSRTRLAPKRPAVGIDRRG